MTPVLVGLAAGVGSALAFGRFLSSQLSGVTARDPMTVAGVAILLLAVAACACWIPARRGSKIDPLSALRFE